MHIDTAHSKRGDKVYVRHLLRDSYRENGKVKHHTVANLGSCSEEEIAALKLALKHKGNLLSLAPASEIEVTQGLSFGGIWVLKQISDRLGITKALGDSRDGKIALWQIFSRIIDQGSRLSALRLYESHAVEEVIGLESLGKEEIYQNLSWLAKCQEVLEQKLFKSRYQKSGKKLQLFLYDVTSSYLEGQFNGLGAYGYNRDGKKGKLQIVIGLLTDHKGKPVSVRVFEGNTSDPTTVATQIKTLAESFGITHVTLVGDRGMLKTPQIDALPEGFRYITAITKPTIRKLVEKGVIQLDLFDETIQEVESEGVRYVFRRNPIRAGEIEKNREQKIESVLKLVKLKNTYFKEHPKSKTETALRCIRAKINKLKLGAWITVQETERELALQMDDGTGKEESLLDGCYVLKTDLSKDVRAEVIHERYKALANVERAFRTMKTGHLEVRPIFVRKDIRTRGHVFVVMLAYMILQELDQLWSELDMTDEEGIKHLERLCLMTLTVKGVKINKIPKPASHVEQLLSKANLILPDGCS